MMKIHLNGSTIHWFIHMDQQIHQVHFLKKILIFDWEIILYYSLDNRLLENPKNQDLSMKSVT